MPLSLSNSLSFTWIPFVKIWKNSYFSDFEPIFLLFAIGPISLSIIKKMMQWTILSRFKMGCVKIPIHVYENTNTANGWIHWMVPNLIPWCWHKALKKWQRWQNCTHQSQATIKPPGKGHPWQMWEFWREQTFHKCLYVFERFQDHRKDDKSSFHVK